MLDLPNCPKCNSEYTYDDGNSFVSEISIKKFRSIFSHNVDGSSDKFKYPTNKHLDLHFEG